MSISHSKNRTYGARSAMIPIPNPAKKRPAHIMFMFWAPVCSAPPSLKQIVVSNNTRNGLKRLTCRSKPRVVSFCDVQECPQTRPPGTYQQNWNDVKQRKLRSVLACAHHPRTVKGALSKDNEKDRGLSYA
jgi:hypothetical protein